MPAPASPSPPMGAAEFRAILARLALTPHSAPRVLPVTRSTAFRYASDGDVDSRLALLLRLMVARGITPADLTAVPAVATTGRR